MSRGFPVCPVGSLRVLVPAVLVQGVQGRRVQPWSVAA